MKREIKFRCPHYYYDGNFAGFSYWGQFGEDVFKSPASWSGTGRDRHEQYTGLKDRNGKEIYEGDIIKRHNYIYLILWGNEIAGFNARCIGREKDFEEGYEPVEKEKHYLIGHRDGITEICGNVHETPELINKKTEA